MTDRVQLPPFHDAEIVELAGWDRQNVIFEIEVQAGGDGRQRVELSSSVGLYGSWSFGSVAVG